MRMDVLCSRWLVDAGYIEWGHACGLPALTFIDCCLALLLTKAIFSTPNCPCIAVRFIFLECLEWKFLEPFFLPRVIW